MEQREQTNLLSVAWLILGLGVVTSASSHPEAFNPPKSPNPLFTAEAGSLPGEFFQDIKIVTPHFKEDL